MMPGNVRARTVHQPRGGDRRVGLGHRRRTSRRRARSWDIAVLLPILDTAELLGLVKSEKGDISLTEFGHKFQKTSKNKVKLLTDLIAKIEPFKTAVELANKQGSVSAEEVGEALAERGITWHHEPEMNQSLLTTILIHWAIYAGLLNYNKSGRFEPIKRSHGA